VTTPAPVRVIVVGGGTAGWMTAAAVAAKLPRACTVRLVESQEIGIVGVGEATLPHLRAFIRTLGIDEAAFMRATHATFKLGIDFQDFGAVGTRYIHPFGSFGRPVDGIGFHHHWRRLADDPATPSIFHYSLPVCAARACRCSAARRPCSP